MSEVGLIPREEAERLVFEGEVVLFSALGMRPIQLSKEDLCWVPREDDRFLFYHDKSQRSAPEQRR